MSIATWKKEFMDWEIQQVPKNKALQYWRQVWIGLRNSNLAKHGLGSYEDELRFIGLRDINDLGSPERLRIPSHKVIYSDTNPLCYHFRDTWCSPSRRESCFNNLQPCPTCPLSTTKDTHSVNLLPPTEHPDLYIKLPPCENPFTHYVLYGEPEPMIQVLTEAIG